MGTHKPYKLPTCISRYLRVKFRISSVVVRRLKTVYYSRSNPARYEYSLNFIRTLRDGHDPKLMKYEQCSGIFDIATCFWKLSKRTKPIIVFLHTQRWANVAFTVLEIRAIAWRVGYVKLKLLIPQYWIVKLDSGKIVVNCSLNTGRGASSFET